MNRNQESIEQLKRLTQAAKNFYGNNYSPGFISHKNDVRHYLGEEYIPYDWGDDIDNPVNDEYKNVYLNKNPNYDFTPKTQNLMQTPKPMQQTTQFQAPKPQTQTMKPKPQSLGLMPKQKPKGLGGYMANYKEIVNDIWDKYGPNIPGYESGQFIADAKIAFDHWKDMNKTNRVLINKYGKGAARGTDDYYHALLQCQLAKLSEADRINGLWMGYAKEMPFDYFRKRLFGMSDEEAEKDGLKDLQNNLNGSNMGAYNKNIPCYKSLGRLITENMKNANIK